jgi:transcription elongation GreA/GreB family factor
MQLVDEWEADPTQGKLSKTSPLGKTLAEGEEGQKYLVVTEKTNYWIKIIRKLIVNSK